jgi:hypothetical protein
MLSGRYMYCAQGTAFCLGKALLLLQATTDFEKCESLCWKDDSSCDYLVVRKEASWQRLPTLIERHEVRVAGEIYRADIWTF